MCGNERDGIFDYLVGSDSISVCSGCLHTSTIYTCRNLCPCNNVCGPRVNIWNTVKDNIVDLLLDTNDTRPFIRVGVVRDSIPGLVNLDSTGALVSKDPGFGPEITRLVCQKLQLNCELHFSSEYHYGERINGSWKGLLGAVSSGVYDTSLPTFTPTMDRIDDFLFPSYFFQFPLAFVTRSPRYDTPSSLAVLLGPFSSKVWQATFACLLLITLALLMSRRIKQRTTRISPRVKILSAFVYSFDVLVSVSLYLARKGPAIKRLSRPGQVVLAVYGLSTVIWVSYYTAKLRNAMLKEAPKLPFSNMQTLIGCIEAQRCQMVFSPPGLYFLSAIMKSTDASDYYPLRLALTSYPPLQVDSEDEMLDRIRNTSSIYLVSYPGLKRRYLSQLGQDCILTMVDYRETVEWDTYPFRATETDLANKFGRVLTLLDRSGIVKKLTSDSPSEGRCESNKSGRSITVQPLSVKIMVGAIWLLLAGCAVALLALMSELLAIHLSQRQ